MTPPAPQTDLRSCYFFMFNPHFSRAHLLRGETCAVVRPLHLGSCLPEKSAPRIRAMRLPCHGCLNRPHQGQAGFPNPISVTHVLDSITMPSIGPTVLFEHHMCKAIGSMFWSDIC